tara:strand:+ start:1827 stop:2843 length:1017 start_codon:yes stop_codon:yes gene_type:complete
MKEMINIFSSAHVLVTGGTGSIGSELVRQLIELNPKNIRVVSNDENGLFELSQELSKQEIVDFYYGDVRDFERMKEVCIGVDYVFHAAALKHVDICEYNPFEALKTNELGTQNVITASLQSNIKKLITISTDKAVDPTTTLGATKLLAEKMTIDANNYTGNNKSYLSCVRFGNVIASRGSVMPIFKQQIETGGPVTVTDKRMTRFFLSLEDSVQLVLEAMKVMKGREIFILKSPSAVRINDLAKVMIESLSPRRKIAIKYIGRRLNEKMHENLMSEEEMVNAFQNESMYIIPQYNLNDSQKRSYGEALEKVVSQHSSDQVSQLSKDEIKMFLKKYNIV